MKTKLKPETRIRVLSRQNSDELYEENTTPWHVHIDFCCALYSVNADDDTILLDDCLKEHDLGIEYYESAIDELIDDGLIEILPGGTK